MQRAAFQVQGSVLTWFLSGNRCKRFRINSGADELGPWDLPGYWKTFEPAGWFGADAFLSENTTGPDKAFVFNGSQVMSIKVNSGRPWADDTLWPEKSDSIANKWKALDIAGFADGVDAAFLLTGNATTGQAWFFRGHQCVLIDYTKNNNELNTYVVKGPAIISTMFPGLGKAGFDSVDCILRDTASTEKRWFFKGTKAVLMNTTFDNANFGKMATDGDGPHEVHTKFSRLRDEGFYPAP